MPTEAVVDDRLSELVRELAHSVFHSLASGDSPVPPLRNYPFRDPLIPKMLDLFWRVSPAAMRGTAVGQAFADDALLGSMLENFGKRRQQGLGANVRVIGRLPGYEANDPQVPEDTAQAAAALTAGLLVSAYTELFLRGRGSDQAGYVESVLQNLDELREAAVGRRARVLTVVALEGPPLPQSLTKETAWGMLISGQHLEMPPSPLVGSPSSGLLLVEDRVPLVPWGGFQWAATEALRRYEAVMEAPPLMPLALALATLSSGEPRMILPRWSTSLAPAEFGMQTFTSDRRISRMSTTAITNDDVDAWMDWWAILRDKHVGRMDLAIDRVVSSIGGRVSDEDSLLDAVVAWDALCGAAGSESMYRVTGALAKLIEEDGGKRMKTKKALEKVYAVRSKVVHGNRTSRGEISSARALAIEVALRALQNLYTRRADLLDLASNQRADQLLVVD